jgi:hypothetical protein
MWKRAAILLLLLPGALAPARVAPQFGRAFRPGTPMRYTGQFLLARLTYPFYDGWSYDWPDMEMNLNDILPRITSIHVPKDGTANIFRMDDPELLKFPVAYLSEPGYWHPSESEVLGLRDYLTKGGFLIVDDFHFDNEWDVFEAAMTRVLPDGIIQRLDLSHPIFNTFFRIKTLHVPYPGRLGEQGLYGEFFGIVDERHPARRLMVVIDYNMDIGDYLEWSRTNRYAVAPSNEAYKFLINYIVYGLTR